MSDDIDPLTEKRRERLEELIKRYFSFVKTPKKAFYYTLPYFRRLINEDFFDILLRTEFKSSRPSSGDVLSDERYEEIQRKFNALFKEVREIKSYLEIREKNKEDALLEYKSLIIDIPEVKFVYCKQTTEGISFWTLFEPSNPSETLREIIKIQIDLENKYDKIFFDFLIDPISENKQLDTTDWIPLFKREL